MSVGESWSTWRESTQTLDVQMSLLALRHKSKPLDHSAAQTSSHYYYYCFNLTFLYLYIESIYLLCTVLLRHIVCSL